MGKRKEKCWLTDNCIECVNSDLKNLKTYMPLEFYRLPRPLNDVEYWKATELRNFILYTGPVVLKGKLKKKFTTIFCYWYLLQKF